MYAHNVKDRGNYAIIPSVAFIHNNQLTLIPQEAVMAPRTNNQKPVRLSEEFAKALKLQDKSERTVKTYVNAVAAFVKFHNRMNPLQATVNHIRAFLFYLREEKGYAPRTYNQFFYGLKAFFEIFLPEVPLMDSFCRMRTKYANITIITRHEFETMIRHTTNLKHRALLEVLYGTGIRVAECAKITFDDIDRKQMLLRVVGKGDKQRFVTLPERTLKTLETYYRACKPQRYLFEGRGERPLTTTMIEHAIRTAARRAGITKKTTPHILRHSFATHFLETDGRLNVLQQLLGHEWIKTTFRYTHVTTDLIKTVISPIDLPASRFAAKGGVNE